MMMMMLMLVSLLDFKIAIGVSVKKEADLLTACLVIFRCLRMMRRRSCIL